eukprot:1691612-Pleurochrysis_carterae.AAC.2
MRGKKSAKAQSTPCVPWRPGSVNSTVQRHGCGGEDAAPRSFRCNAVESSAQHSEFRVFCACSFCAARLIDRTDRQATIFERFIDGKNCGAATQPELLNEQNSSQAGNSVSVLRESSIIKTTTDHDVGMV